MFKLRLNTNDQSRFEASIIHIKMSKYFSYKAKI